MKVAQVSQFDLAKPGGLEVHVVELARALQVLGVEVTVFAPGLRELAGLRGVDVKDFSPTGFDVVHTHLRWGFQPLRLRRSGAAMVHTYHGTSLSNFLWLRNWRAIGQRWAWQVCLQEALAGWLARRVIAVSRQVRREVTAFYGIPGAKVVTIPNGCTPGVPEAGLMDRLRTEHHIDGDTFWFLFVGRNDPVKRPGLARSAFLTLRDKYQDVGLLMAPGQESVPADRIHATGALPHEAVTQLYFLADAFLSTSANEGMPLCILEAMSAGLPIVATEVGGTRELIQHEENGLLVDHRGNGLVEAMDRLYGSPELRRRLGTQAQADSHRYTWDRVAEATLAVYRAALIPEAEVSEKEG